MTTLGRFFLIFGILFLIMSIFFYVLGSLGVNRLPGDILWKRDGVTIYIPIGLMILLSLLLTILANLFFYFFKR